MFKMAFLTTVILFSCYPGDKVHGKQPEIVPPLADPDKYKENLAKPELTKGSTESPGQIAEEVWLSSAVTHYEVPGEPHIDLVRPLAASSTDDFELAAIPGLTEGRIEFLRQISGNSPEDDLSSAIAFASAADNLIKSSNAKTTEPAVPNILNNVPSANSEWASQVVNSNSGAKEGIAFSGWTVLSPSADWPGEKIHATLVAGCNGEGERSLYIRTPSPYPGSEAGRRVNTVRGRVGWDSSDPYGAPFSYDAELNALRLKAGVEDSLSMIKDGKKVTIQIPWHDGHEATFEFSLKGSSQALKTAFDHCLSQAI